MNTLKFLRDDELESINAGAMDEFNILVGEGRVFQVPKYASLIEAPPGGPVGGIYKSGLRAA